MFNIKEVKDTIQPTADGGEISVEKTRLELPESKAQGESNGGEKFFIKTDNVETLTSELLEDLLDYDAKEAKAVTQSINEYLKHRMEQIDNIQEAKVDDIFSKENFVEIVKQYGDKAVVPATVYWTTLRQAFVDFQAYEYGEVKNSESAQTLDQHGNRVRAVTEAIIAMIPYGTAAKLAYTFTTGKNPERILKRIDALSEKIVGASDASMYLAAKVGIGAVETVENGIEYGGAAAAYLTGHKEKAQEILSLNLSKDMKEKLDKLYGRENWVRVVGDSVEHYGAMATQIGLTALLSTGGITAVAAGAGLVLEKAGEVTKADMAKTGELSGKKLVHGAVAGATSYGFAELASAGVNALNKTQIADEVARVVGKSTDSKVVEAIAKSVTVGLEAGAKDAIYSAPEQLSKKLDKAFDIDPKAKIDWTDILGNAAHAFETAHIYSMILEMRKSNIERMKSDL